MYLQISERCNMLCAHCGFACTEAGEDMSFEVFQAALSYDSESISIGGGEPTVHPEFWKFLAYAIAKSDYVWLATNGKRTQDALTLAKMAAKGVIGCTLSQDDYHEPIDCEVVDAFNRPARSRDYYGGDDQVRDLREIRTVTEIYAAGRAASFGRPGCLCEGAIVKPNGDVYQCACPDAPKLGDVFGGFTVESYSCWKTAACV